jgi:hypothetical protein
MQLYTLSRGTILIVNISRIISKQSINNNNFIIGGDYNAKDQKWGCRVNNPRGTVFHNFLTSKNFIVLVPPGPTYWPSSPQKNPDILDIFVAKILTSLYCNTDNIFDLNSDHSSVLLTLND